jgi:hypothetical protein
MSPSRLTDPMRQQRLRLSEIAGARTLANPPAEQHLIKVPDASAKQPPPWRSLPLHGITRYEVELAPLLNVVRPTVKRFICFPGRTKQEVLSEAATDGFTASRETNDASPSMCQTPLRQISPRVALMFDLEDLKPAAELLVVDAVQHGEVSTPV